MVEAGKAVIVVTQLRNTGTRSGAGSPVFPRYVKNFNHQR